MNENEMLKSLAALSHSSRLRIFRTLIMAGPTGLTPGQLYHQLNIPAATMSFHLKELTNASLVLPIRNGRHLIYSAQFDQINSVISYLTENCCQGKDCQTQPTGEISS
jgi:predicted transcriptional regulator